MSSSISLGSRLLTLTRHRLSDHPALGDCGAGVFSSKTNHEGLGKGKTQESLDSAGGTEMLLHYHHGFAV